MSNNTSVNYEYYIYRWIPQKRDIIHRNPHQNHWLMNKNAWVETNDVRILWGQHFFFLSRRLNIYLQIEMEIKVEFYGNKINNLISIKTFCPICHFGSFDVGKLCRKSPSRYWGKAHALFTPNSIFLCHGKNIKWISMAFHGETLPVAIERQRCIKILSRYTSIHIN